MAILHIYGARSIFLLFHDHQDTKYEACEIEMSISQPIYTHKNISKALKDNDKIGKHNCGNSSYLWS